MQYVYKLGDGFISALTGAEQRVFFCLPPTAARRGMERNNLWLEKEPNLRTIWLPA